ncbi:hypothetical protein QOZ80_5AG0367610 [Eleusine coracana subsp. coracana]|nr:hypothetical protein QOZ80_5AG0367610 [Eleusine coracana subsp. coracana]
MAAAAAHHRAAALLAVVAATALLLADAAAGHRERQGPQAAMAVCVKAHGVEAGETCASVARNWGMSDRAFANLNPNVTCAALFPGQWLCVDGAVIG